MLDFQRLARQAARHVLNNSPLILTVVGVTGTLTTAYLAGKASFKAAEILADEPDLDTREQVQIVWKLYIPAATTGLITVAAIIGANRIGARKAAALAAAYALSERSFEEYQAKVLEKMGERKEREVHDEVVRERIHRNPPTGDLVVVNGGQVLCQEGFSGRYFMADMETLRKAENDINRQIINDGFASLADLYDILGLQHTDLSTEMGWNSEQEVKFRYTVVMSEDSRPCISFSFSIHPFRHFTRFH
jgi:hypothetical protein